MLFFKFLLWLLTPWRSEVTDKIECKSQSVRVKIDYRTLPDFDSRLHIVCFGVSSEFDIHTIDYHYHLEKDDCLLKQIIFLEKDVFRLVTSVTNKNFWVPRNRTSDFWISRTDALPLSYKDSTVSDVYYEVHVTRTLHTAMLIASYL